MNEYRGEVRLVLGEATHTLRYSWSTVLELRRIFGTDFDQRISEAILALELETVAQVLALGLRESWPQVTADDVLKASPPVAVAVDALKTALHYAFNGPGEVTAKAAENPLKAAMSRLQRILYKLHWWRQSLPV